MQTVTVPMESLAEIVRLQLEHGGKATLTVTGNSMYPMLVSHRDSVILIPPDNLQKGDVILFQRVSGAYILHRIIALTAEGYICCGDNQTIGEPVRREQVVAVVSGFIRKEKSCQVDNGFYRAYTAIWMRMFSLRRIYYISRRYFGRFRRKLRNVYGNK